MAVRIRLARHGRKASPFYHIVAADSRAPRDGRFIEKIGTFNPMKNPAIVELDFDRALHWVTVGGQPSDTVRSILKKEGVLYKRHLEVGVLKGAFDEAAAEQKFQAWLEKKREENQENLDKIQAKADADAKSKLEAEKKVSDDRAAQIAAKLQEAEAVAQAEETPAEEEAAAEESTEETPAE